MWAPTHWEGHTWAEEVVSYPFCIPQKSVPQELFGVTKRLIGSTKGMKGAILPSIPKTRNKFFWFSLRRVVAVDLGAMWYLMFLGAL